MKQRWKGGRGSGDWVGEEVKQKLFKKWAKNREGKKTEKTEQDFDNCGLI